MPKEYHQLFTVDDGRFLYLGQPLSKSIVDESKGILEAHVLKKPTPRAVFERAIYSITTAFNGLEKGCSFMERFRNDSLDELTNSELVNRRAKEAKLVYEDDRYSGVIEYLLPWWDCDNFDDFVDKQINYPHAVREELVKIQGIGYKVASMFNLCCGGTRLITLDRHNLRQAKGLSESLDSLVQEKYAFGKLRTKGKTKGRKIPVGLPPNTYTQIENELIQLVKNSELPDKFPEFIDERGFINGALITALFWWEGVKMRKVKGPPHQQKLFQMLEFPSPFTE